MSKIDSFPLADVINLNNSITHQTIKTIWILTFYQTMEKNEFEKQQDKNPSIETLRWD